jgi:hypothetical protein
MRNHLETILIQGFAGFDAMYCMVHIVLPVLTFLLDIAVIPNIVARLLCMLTGQVPPAVLATLCTALTGTGTGAGGDGACGVDSAYLLRTLLVRYCYHAYIAAHLCAHGAARGCRYLWALHRELRDSKYLVGTKLANRVKVGAAAGGGAQAVEVITPASP